jgi:hypothetical protein
MPADLVCFSDPDCRDTPAGRALFIKGFFNAGLPLLPDAFSAGWQSFDGIKSNWETTQESIFYVAGITQTAEIRMHAATGALFNYAFNDDAAKVIKLGGISQILGN